MGASIFSSATEIVEKGSTKAKASFETAMTKGIYTSHFFERADATTFLATCQAA